MLLLSFNSGGTVIRGEPGERCRPLAQLALPIGVDTTFLGPHPFGGLEG